MTGTSATPTFERHLIGLAVAACFAGAVHANPTGPTVVNGSASFATNGNALTVTNTPGAIINWQQFSIRPDEVTRFIQSGAASAVLNRVTGPQQSAILGQLLSNGRVFLINPNGVVIGAGARIDTAGFVASSLSLSNEDFLAGRFRFTDPGNAGKVTNAGTINAHAGAPVYLIAPTVENHGVITAPNGDILLAAGKSVELVSAGNPSLRVQVQAGGDAVNIGQLLAESGRVGLYGAALRNAGTISADSASVNAAGNVVLRASRDVTLERTSVVTANGAQGGAVHVQAEAGTLLADGRIEAKGATGAGGDVKLLGTQIGLVGNAAVDASGASGGTVLVGGDYQGGNSAIQNARATYVDPAATIKADAAQAGDGGRVIVWSDEYTGFYGAISARGGAQAGNGGFVETSSKANLQAIGIVDAAAPAGRAGEWLLDPSDVTVTTSTSGGAFGGGSPNIFTPAAAAANANAATINASLNAGTSVTINTASAAGGNGDIVVNSAISKTTATGSPTLTLNAVRDITVNAAMQGSAAGNVLNVAMNAGRAVAFGGGGSINTRNGNVTVNAGTTAALGAINTGTGTLSVTSNGNVTQTGTLTVGGTATFAPGAGNSVTLATAANNFGTVVFTNGANATIRDSNALVFGNTNLTGTLNATAGGAITDAGTIAVGGLASFKTVVNAGAAITLDTAANSFGSLSVQARNAADTANAAGAITVTRNGALTLETVGTTSNATFNSGTGGNITQTGTSVATVGGTATFAPGAGNSVTLANAANNFGTVAFTNGSNATIRDSNALVFGNTNLTGTLNATAGGAITDSGAISVGGPASFKTLGGGAITLDTATNSFGSLSVQSRNAADTANAAGAITVTKNGPLVLETVGTTGNATVTTSGNVTQTGTSMVSVGGTAAFTPGAGNSVTLANAGNDFGTVRQTNGANFTVRDANAVIVGATSLTGMLNATAGGAITDSGAITVGGPATFKPLNHAGAAITLDTATNSFGSLSVQARNAADTANAAGAITVSKNGALVLETVGTTGNATVTTSGNVTQTGTSVVTVAGTATFTPGAGNSVTLANAANDFGTVRQTNGANFTVRDANGVVVGATAITGTLNVTAGGSVTQSGVVTANTLTGTLAGAGSALNFGTSANNIANLGPITAPGGFTLTNGNNPTTVVGAIDTSAGNGAVSISTGTAAAGYTQNNVDVVAGAGNITINANAVNIAANTGDNAFQTTGTLTLRPNTAATTMSLAAAAPSTFALSAAEITAITAGTGTPTNIVIGNATNSTAAMTIGAPVSFGAKTVTLNAGSFTDGAVAGRTITAETLNLNARTGAIGAAGAGAIDVAATNLTVNTVNQNAFVNATGGVTFGPGGSSTGTGSLTLSSTGSVTQTGALAVGGTATLAAGANDITLTHPANNFGTVVVNSGNAVSLVDSNALTVGVSTVGTLTARTLSGNLTLGGNVTATGGGDSIVLAAAGNFLNPSSRTLTPGTGRWLVYSTNPASDVRGGLVYAFKQYAATYGVTPVLGAGNGFLYSVAPSITATLAGTATKTYDGTTVAPIGGLALTPTGGAIDGDTLSSAALTGANYDTRNVGAGKLVTATGATVTANNAGRPVYGYQVNLATASANVGTINPAALTVTAQADSRVYNGTTSSSVAPVVSGTLYDPIGTAAIQTYDNKNVGSGKTLTAGGLVMNDGNGGANYSVSYVTNTAGVITAAPLTVTAQADSRVYNGTTSSSVAPVVSGTLYDPIGAAPTQTYDNRNAGTGKTLTAGGLVMNDGNGGANYSVSYVTNTSGVITPAPVTVTAQADSRVYDGTTNSSVAPVVSGTLYDPIGTAPMQAYDNKNVGTGKTLAPSGLVMNDGNGGANYSATYVDNTSGVITPAALTIAADNKTRQYGDPNPPLTATFTGLVPGDTPADIAGLTITTPAAPASNVGPYAITPAGGVNPNYTIGYVNGAFTIVPAPLTITADNASRVTLQPNPPFAATYSGFKLGQTPAVLGGALAFTTPATITSPAGAYAITPSGQTSTNYTITYLDGVLIVLPVPASTASGVNAADNAFITATQRSVDAESELESRVPGAKRIDCLELERAGVRRVLSRCF